MDGLIKQQLNALAQVARIDGHFADSEKEVLEEIARKYGKEDEELKEIIENPTPVEDMSDISDFNKLEFMYIAIRIMRADGLIQDSEVDFCKLLAMKMRMDPTIVDEYATVEELHFESYMEDAKKFLES